jgi:hypothetical protein
MQTQIIFENQNCGPAVTIRSQAQTGCSRRASHEKCNIPPHPIAMVARHLKMKVDKFYDVARYDAYGYFRVRSDEGIKNFARDWEVGRCPRCTHCSGHVTQEGVSAARN